MDTSIENNEKGSKIPEFRRFLDDRGIANAFYLLEYAQHINVELNIDVYCYRRVQIAQARSTIMRNLNEFFEIRQGHLGRSYYRSDIYNFIKGIRDEQGEIVDYLIINTPASDIIISNKEYARLTGQMINVYPTNRQT